MGAACYKQFENVPNQFPDDYEQQRERISTNSIKMQHKNFRPNSKNVTIGMIDTILESQVVNLQPRSGQFGVNDRGSLGPSRVMGDSKVNEKFRHTTESRALDLEELHSTQRPFQSAEMIVLGTNETLIPKQQMKNRQLLDFTFYHSLGLQEYNYRPYPPAVAAEYQNLPVCQQQIRNGVKYIGQWKGDLKSAHGNGVMQSNTTKYIGQFRNGLKHFHGREIQKDEVYEGQFQDGRRKGVGRRYLPGIQEEGIFDEHLIKGKITYKNGSTYEGELLKNKYHGQGKFINKSSNMIQQGTFRNGKLHGRGRIQQYGSLVYEGQFEEDLKHGKGTYYWDRNNYYKGFYSRDKKHGPGELVKGDTIYRGRFKNGSMDGPIEVFDNSQGRQTRKKTMNFNNGIRDYDDQELSTFSSDGMPRQWRQAITRKRDLDTSDRLDNKSSSFNSENIIRMGREKQNYQLAPVAPASYIVPGGPIQNQPVQEMRESGNSSSSNLISGQIKKQFNESSSLRKNEDFNLMEMDLGQSINLKLDQASSKIIKNQPMNMEIKA